MTVIDRAQLARDLADARAENELLRRQYANRLIRDRERWAAYRARARASRESATSRVREEAAQILANLPADPNAAQHRLQLLNALKGRTA